MQRLDDHIDALNELPADQKLFLLLRAVTESEDKSRMLPV
jgi:hypothetical protein